MMKPLAHYTEEVVVKLVESGFLEAGFLERGFWIYAPSGRLWIRAAEERRDRLRQLGRSKYLKVLREELSLRMLIETVRELLSVEYTPQRDKILLGEIYVNDPANLYSVSGLEMSVEPNSSLLNSARPLNHQ